MSVRVVVSAAALSVLASSAHADVIVSTDPTQNMTCSGGVCSPTQANAVLNVNDLANMLATADTKVTTGSGAVNIDVVAALSWSSASRLTLDANTGLNVQAAVTVAGSGALTLTYNDGGKNGDLIFSNGGNATFANLGSSLIINGNRYKLAADLRALARQIKKNLSGFYALANSYDASVDGTYAASPIRGQFQGAFEGLGNAIINLKINADPKKKYVGLFEQVPYTNIGVLRDIQLVNANVAGSSIVGILAGENAGTIANASATGVVVSAGHGGGLVGSHDTGLIRNCHTNVTVNATGSAGGLAGFELGGGSPAIFQSSASGAVSGGLWAGGLAGINYGSVERSYATGNVTGAEQSYTAGLVGADGLGSAIADSYATGNVKAGQSALVGGLVGFSYKWKGHQNASSVSTSYSLGPISSGRKSKIGGFAGNVDGVQSNYWDLTTSKNEHGVGKGRRSGGSCSRNVTGLSDDQLKAGLPTGFDPKIWGQSPNINNGYPYLLANPPQ